jgi:hypothetical protein
MNWSDNGDGFDERQIENILETEIFDLVSVVKNAGERQDHEQDIEKVDKEKIKENSAGCNTENHG